MSLILEALKKSEAKRRLGEAPDLGTPFAAPKRRGNLLPVLLVAIVAAGGFGWWILRQPATDAKASADKKTVASAPTPSAAPPTSRPQAAAPAQAQTPPVARPQPTAPKSAPPAAPADASKFVAMGGQSLVKRGGPMQAPKLPPNMHRVQPQTPAAAPPPAEPPKMAAAPPADKSVAPVEAHNAATKTAPAAPAKAPKTADTKGLAPAPAAPVLAKAPKTPDMLGLTPPGEAAKTADAAPPPAKNDLPLYYELPYNVRKSLPALRLSMHVYAGDPKQRFVILNDSRLGEGDKTADDVTLREVRKDGAVLEFQGQRFFYPRDNL